MPGGYTQKVIQSQYEFVWLSISNRDGPLATRFLCFELELTVQICAGPRLVQAQTRAM